jgi:putative phosphoribosyl transferase
MIYQDRTDAGQHLAQALSSYKNEDNVGVLGLARGGVPVAREVASEINAPLDLLVVRKLGVPQHKELAMGAIAPDACWLNQDIIQSYHVSEAAIEQVRQQEQQELERREKLYRQNLPSLDLRDRIIILVDDGLATGATLRVAALSVRHHQPKRIIAAVPVAAPPICDREALAVDDVVCLETPEQFYAVGFWYENFAQVNDAQVQQSLQSARDRQPTTTG